MTLFLKCCINDYRRNINNPLKEGGGDAGTFDEMESDFHLPEEYGIYQSAGDTNGHNRIIHTLRTSPMFEEITNAIRKYSPKDWGINYTKPMKASVDALLP